MKKEKKKNRKVIKVILSSILIKGRNEIITKEHCIFVLYIILDWMSLKRTIKSLWLP